MKKELLKKTSQKKKICDKTMTFDECELAILRSAVDIAEERVGKETINSPQIQEIIEIVETFLQQRPLIVYGGTAINAILPKEDQFYNRDIELPDYDFFSPHAMEDAKDLADIYVKNGFREVEAKPGVHFGTYKVFVNFIPVADITYLHQDIFNAIKKEVIIRDKIKYAPANYLRMSMYLELSRPAGDVSRWEKVLKRLTLLNKHYPLETKQCDTITFQRQLTDPQLKKKAEELFELVRDSLSKEDVIFFGGYAMNLYSQYMPKPLHHKFKKYPDFDVLSEKPEQVAKNIKKILEKQHIQSVTITKKPAIGEIIAPHYEIKIGKGEIIAFVYEPLACHSYNKIKVNGKIIKIATIDTMLSFYLAFLYANRPYYDTHRILCMSQYLFKVQQENRLKQSGLLRRFSINCYGHQETLEELRSKKAETFLQLRNKKNTPEYEAYFMRYRPGDELKEKSDSDSDSSDSNSDFNSDSDSVSDSVSNSSDSDSDSDFIEEIDDEDDDEDNDENQKAIEKEEKKKNWKKETTKQIKGKNTWLTQQTKKKSKRRNEMLRSKKESYFTSYRQQKKQTKKKRPRKKSNSWFSF